MVRKLILYLLASIGLLFLVATCTPLVYWWATQLAGEWRDPKGEVLIVLGGSVLDYGTIGGSSYWRGIYAVEVYREGGYRQVVVTGEEAAPAIRDFLECHGVPAEAIRVEDRSSTTRENALYTMELLKAAPGRKILLTSDYHMLRARAAFSKAGLDVMPRPFPDIRKRAGVWRARWPAFLDLVEETVKIGYYYVKGWI